MFASPTGLKILSESKKWHGDGTFHTKSKYFAQLYTLHGYFPPGKYDPKDNKVWVKRMIPCAWILMRLRRTKDYECVLKNLKDAACKYTFVLDPDQVMIDFEIAAQKAFQKIFTRCSLLVVYFTLVKVFLKCYAKLD